MPPLHVNPDITKAQTPSTDIYLSESLFAQMREKVFAPSWQFSGDTDPLKQAGDMRPFTFLEGCLDEPLVWTRDEHQALHCLSNVCTHRGNMVVNEACRARQLTCRYHGRRFGLDGTFTHMPEFREVEDFPTSRDNLTRVPYYQWGKWLFTSLHPDYPAKAVLNPMIERMSWLPLHAFEHSAALSRDFVLEANWALYCENYVEGFHIPFVHAGLSSKIDFGNYKTELFDFSSVQIAPAKKDDLVFDLPEGHPDAGKNVAAYYFFIFPNLMFNFYPWGLSINIVKPERIDRTRISYLVYVLDEAKLEQGAGADLDTVEMEDEEVVLAVQQGIRSRFYAHGRYSATRETGTHHFHQLLINALQ